MSDLLEKAMNAGLFERLQKAGLVSSEDPNWKKPAKKVSNMCSLCAAEKDLERKKNWVCIRAGYSKQNKYSLQDDEVRDFWIDTNERFTEEKKSCDVCGKFRYSTRPVIDYVDKPPLTE